MKIAKCATPSFRLRLEDGGYVFMSWHDYCGPTFFHDKNETRVVEEWWDNQLICDILGWFLERGNRA